MNAYALAITLVALAEIAALVGLLVLIPRRLAHVADRISTTAIISAVGLIAAAVIVAP